MKSNNNKKREQVANRTYEHAITNTYTSHIYAHLNIQTNKQHT